MLKFVCLSAAGWGWLWTRRSVSAQQWATTGLSVQVMLSLHYPHFEGFVFLLQPAAPPVWASSTEHHTLAFPAAPPPLPRFPQHCLVLDHSVSFSRKACLIDTPCTICPPSQHCLVYDHSVCFSCEAAPMKSGRDVWWNEAVLTQPSSCEVEWVDAEDPLFKLYTSGSTGTGGRLGRLCLVWPDARRWAPVERAARGCGAGQWVLLPCPSSYSELHQTTLYPGLHTITLLLGADKPDTQVSIRPCSTPPALSYHLDT